jgi:hypothetical protein
MGHRALHIFDEFDFRWDNGWKKHRLCFGVKRVFSFASRLNHQLATLQRNNQIESFSKLESSDVLGQDLGVDSDGYTDGRTIIRPPVFVGDLEVLRRRIHRHAAGSNSTKLGRKSLEKASFSPWCLVDHLFLLEPFRPGFAGAQHSRWWLFRLTTKLRRQENGLGNGSNVRTMRTRFPPGRKSGEQQQENTLGLAIVGRRQGAHGFSGEGAERLLRSEGSIKKSPADGNGA